MITAEVAVQSLSFSSVFLRFLCGRSLSSSRRGAGAVGAQQRRQPDARRQQQDDHAGHEEKPTPEIAGKVMPKTVSAQVSRIM